MSKRRMQNYFARLRYERAAVAPVNPDKIVRARFGEMTRQEQRALIRLKKRSSNRDSTQGRNDDSR